MEITITWRDENEAVIQVDQQFYYLDVTDGGLSLTADEDTETEQDAVSIADLVAKQLSPIIRNIMDTHYRYNAEGLCMNDATDVDMTDEVQEYLDGWAFKQVLA